MLAQSFNDDERRSSPRIPHRGEVTIQVGSEVFPARLVDVGRGGLAILPSREPPRGFLRLTFRVDPNSGLLDLDGIVVRSQRYGEGYLWGVKFHGLDLGTRVRLRDWVAAANS